MITTTVSTIVLHSILFVELRDVMLKGYEQLHVNILGTI